MYLLRMENERVIHVQGKSLSLDQPQAREFPQILFLGGCLLVILSEAGIPLPGGLINKTILEIIISQQKQYICRQYIGQVQEEVHIVAQYILPEKFQMIDPGLSKSIGHSRSDRVFLTPSLKVIERTNLDTRTICYSFQNQDQTVQNMYANFFETYVGLCIPLPFF